MKKPFLTTGFGETNKNGLMSSRIYLASPARDGQNSSGVAES